MQVIQTPYIPCAFAETEELQKQYNTPASNQFKLLAYTLTEQSTTPIPCLYILQSLVMKRDNKFAQKFSVPDRMTRG